MDPARWERLQRLFHAALARPVAERDDFLRAETGGDPDLMAEVRRMLAADAGDGTPLDAGLARLAEQVLHLDTAELPLADFGPYRVTRLLGEGGMGVVYLARREDLGSVAAIKILRDAWLSPARRERFAAEQRTLAQLHHPAIAQLHDANTLPDGTPWFVMEYVEGVSLTEYCRRHRTTLEGRLELFRRVAEAVQYAHAQAVIHRDLKPSNILVTADGQVKLLDFGIAKHLEASEETVDQTQTGLRMMTPAYASPEQVRGGRVGIQTDVYSLGVVLYELLAGRPPFDLAGKTPAEALAMVVEVDPERPSVAAGRTSETQAPRARAAGRTAWADLDVLCLTAMHKDPARRYPTVEALLRDVGHYLAGEPLEARADTLGYRLGKFVRRRRAAVMAASAVFALLVGTVVYYTVRLTRARNVAVAEAARTHRIQRYLVNLFQGGDEAVGPADSLHVLTLVERGIAEARDLEGEPLVQAELYQTLGVISQQLGHLDRADSLLSLSVSQRGALLGPDHPDVAEGMVALGQLRVEQARYEEGEALIRSALEITRRRLPPGHPAVLRALSALGQVLQARGEYDEAIAVQAELVALYRAEGPESPDLGATMSELASSHFYAGHYDTADSLNTLVLALSRRVYGDRHPMVAEDLINLGATQLERGDYPAAEAYDRQALEITRAWYGEDHPKTAAGLTLLARALVYQQKFAEADSLLQEALAIRERVYGPNHPMVASTVNELGNIAVAEDRYDEAVAHFGRMVAIYRAAYGGKHYLIGTALSNMASAYNADKQYARAEALFREALAMFEATLPPDHTSTAIAHIKLGRSLLRQRRFVEAAPETLAGYTIIKPQAAPGNGFLRAARIDLAAIYDTLGQPERAAVYRRELADTAQ